MLLLQMIKGNLEIWQWLLLAAVLIPSTIRDIRTKRINIYLCLVAILVALYFRTAVLGEENLSILLSLLPGALTYSLAVLSGEKIGKGDAFLIGFIGSVAGTGVTVRVLLVSFFLSGAVSLCLLVFRKMAKDAEIPLAPFLSIGVIAGGII